jgi:hypothetical protein
MAIMTIMMMTMVIEFSVGEMRLEILVVGIIGIIGVAEIGMIGVFERMSGEMMEVRLNRIGVSYPRVTFSRIQVEEAK